LADDPYSTVARNALAALELFTTTAGLPLRDEVPTPPTAPRTTRTTTVGTQTGTIARAIGLTMLARENMAFFQKNAFGTSGGLQSAQRALRDVDQFLKANGRSLTAAVERNIALVQAELKRTDQEVKDLDSALRQEKAPDAKALLEGNINLAGLRTLRLRQLLTDNKRIADFVRLSGRTASKR
jgi:hypothetical protein